MSLDAFSSVTIGVTDRATAVRLWRDTFGLEVVRERPGNDADLARFWGLQPEEIGWQMLLSTGDYRIGMVHLVEFVRPLPAVRVDARAFDLCPKNIDVYVHDLPAKTAELQAAGWQFRGEQFSELQTATGSTFREIHMRAHDHINIVLLEVFDAQRPLTENGYGAVGPMIYTVADHADESAFVAAVFDMEKLHQNLFAGPEIEAMIGLPQGVSLDVSVWGSEARPLGKIELVEYRGAQGTNLYPRARPGATGVLHLNFVTPDIDELCQRLTAAAVTFTEQSVPALVPGAGRVLTFHTPAGLRIDAFSAFD